MRLCLAVCQSSVCLGEHRCLPSALHFGLIVAHAPVAAVWILEFRLSCLSLEPLEQSRWVKQREHGNLESYGLE